jgi:hypothetical protein
MNQIEKYTNELRPLSIKFSSGNIAIDNFLSSDDALDKTIGITYVLLDEERTRIIGYFNISVSRIDEIRLQNGEVTYHPLGGAAKINYLAVDSKFQHQLLYQTNNGDKKYIGDYLLGQCEQKIWDIHNDIGIAFIYLSSTKEGYHMYRDRNFYEDLEDDMNVAKNDKDLTCKDLYKYIDDLYYYN